MAGEGAPETAAPHPSDSIPALACQAGACASRPARGLRLPVAPPARADSLAARAITTPSNADRLPGKNAVCFSYPSRLAVELPIGLSCSNSRSFYSVE